MPKLQRSRQFSRAAFVALGLTAAMLLVAVAARDPLGRSTPVDAASAGAPATALFVVLVGAGCVALAAIAMAVWPGRRRKADDEPEPEHVLPEVHWIWRLLAVLLPLALGAAMVAAALLGAGHRQPVPRVVIGPFAASTARAPRTARPNGFVLPGWLPWTVLTILVVAVGAGVLLLVNRRTRDGAEPAQRIASRAAVQAAIAALAAASDPREAVIAAYVAMQETLAGHGVARAASEAPREYLRRVLASSSATGREARTLTGLFEEARFSEHPISERVRRRALAALSSLQTRLKAADAA
jgi:hypothetical protein